MDTINYIHVHPTIKFKHEVSKTELTFLDVTVFEVDNKLDIKTHNLLKKQINNSTYTKPLTTLHSNAYLVPILQAYLQGLANMAFFPHDSIWLLLFGLSARVVAFSNL